ncbi:MAG TPA: GDP-mannose 4,6-dehydratase [Tepidisphaeraceae bacterium]|nr:GDP-mannose 4,6-dehydratase [Tepidisphaeraceae bacterium]
MRVLISGVAGLIGSHLADLLLSQGHSVVGVDNFITGSRRNIEHLKDNDQFSLIEQDVIEPVKIEGRIDQIYHLASPSSPVAYTTHRVQTMRVNSQGTCNLLELAVEKGARFLVASTAEVYGDPVATPQREEHWGNVNPIGLNSVYEESKRFSEACAMAYHRERQADTRIARIFNTYGPRMSVNDGRVITTFIYQTLSNEPLTVYGDGTQVRCFCYVSDMVAGLIKTMEGDFHEPINLGNPQEVAMVELAKEILHMVPESRSKIVFQPAPVYDPRVRRPDIARAKQILGWSPKVARVEGLAKTVQYYRECHKR